MAEKAVRKRIKVINPDIRFEFSVPDDVPTENMGLYAWEKLRRICKVLSKSGLKVTPVIPRAYTALLK